MLDDDTAPQGNAANGPKWRSGAGNRPFSRTMHRTLTSATRK